MRPLLLVAMVSLAAGCGPTPFDEPLNHVPPRVIIRQPVAPSPESAASWESSQELEVESLVAEVLARNPTLQAMEQARRAAAARRAQVTSLDDPMLSYGVAPLSLADRSMRDGHEVRLSQMIPWPGKLHLRGQAADHEAYAAAHDLESARQELAHEARRAFYDYYYIRRATEINAANLELLREFQRIAESKYAAGTTSKQDALQAQIQALELEHEAIVLQRMRRVSIATINTLLHRRANAQLPPPPANVAPLYERPPIDRLIDRAVEARPELQSLAQRLEASRSRRQSARLDYLPDFTAMTSYSTMWDDPEHRWMLGGEINLPIQLGRRRGAEIEAVAESQRLAAELAARIDRVGLEITDAYERLVESEHLIELYVEQFRPTAGENLDSARAAYEAGDGDFLTLLIAERDQRLIELAHQQALVEYHQGWADLRRAVGGNVHPEPGGDHNAR